jgi:exopolyphosphatase / guanosine-5'-triphosphate,3'-diphosphate pyrophosphatase
VRLSCIDIGSNTTRLLVADCDAQQLEWIHQERSFTRLGNELFEHGTIRPAKIAEVVDVVRDQRDVAARLGATAVHAVATEALRSAANGSALVAAIHDATGLSVEVLSEAEEARLAFVGATGTLREPPSERLGVVDVGGGSSELVVGEAPDQVQWWASVPLGSGRLTRRHLFTDPPTEPELSSARTQIAAELAGLDAPRPSAVVAVGGSATSLSRVAGPVLSSRVLAQALMLLGAERSTKIAIDYEIDAERARLLPAGLLILGQVAELFRAPLVVGHGGIREGVLLEASSK